MININPVVRDSEGYGVHPLIPDTDDEFIDLSKIEAFKGLKISRVSLEFDAAEEVIDGYFRDGNTDISKWDPTLPSRDAVLIAVSDTDDGPMAWFVRESDGEVHR